jgi:pimeloyl-ACP methyl ester carboxylesterase
MDCRHFGPEASAMPMIEFDQAKPAVPEGAAEETVLLLHSSASSGAQWRDLCGQLADRFVVLAPDLYGYGAAEPWPGQAAMTLADEVARIEALLAQHPGPLHLVGHSYGGAVALRLALQAKGRVRSLTLIEPVAFHLLLGGSALERALYAEIAGLARRVATALCSGAYWSAMAAFVDYWNGAGAFDQLSPERRQDLSRRIGTVALNFSAVMEEAVPLSAYRQIEAPTLLLAGAMTAPTTRQIVELLGRALPHACSQVIAGAGHMLPLTHRDPVNIAIAGHLDRHACRLRVAA